MKYLLNDISGKRAVIQGKCFHVFYHYTKTKRENLYCFILKYNEYYTQEENHDDIYSIRNDDGKMFWKIFASSNAINVRIAIYSNKFNFKNILNFLLYFNCCINLNASFFIFYRFDATNFTTCDVWNKIEIECKCM